MKLENTEKPLLFSETALPDVFFVDFLAQIPGDYVKIYLYIVFLAKYNKDIKLKFYKDKFILEGIKELYLINGNHIETNIEVNSLLTKSIFSNDNTYRYIMYNDIETQKCYVPELIAEVGFEDKESYSIYSLLFNEQTLEFEEPKLVVTRKRSDNCDTLNNDLASMVS